MVDEFNLPESIIDRKVTKMKMISPSNREVDVGKTLGENEYIGMLRREVLDAYLRDRAKEHGTTVINGLAKSVKLPQGSEGPIKILYNNYDNVDGKVSRVGERCVMLEVGWER